MKCSTGVAEGDEKARIVCSDDDMQISFAKYGTQEERDGALDGSDRKLWKGGTCEVATTTLETNDEGTENRIGVTLVDEKPEFGIIIDGSEIMDRFQKIPFC